MAAGLSAALQQASLTVLEGNKDTDLLALINDDQQLIIVADESTASEMLTTEVTAGLENAGHVRSVIIRKDGSPLQAGAHSVPHAVTSSHDINEILDAVRGQILQIQAGEDQGEPDYLAGVLERLEVQDTAEPAASVSSDWVTESDAGERFLHLFMAEVDAYASMIVHEGNIWAVDGQFSKQDFHQLGQIIKNNWNETTRYDLMKYLRLDSSGRQYATYAASIRPGYVLAVLFDVYMPMNEMRTQTSHLAKRLDLVLFRPHKATVVKNEAGNTPQVDDESGQVPGTIRVDDLLKMDTSAEADTTDTSDQSGWLPEIPVSPTIETMITSQKEANLVQDLSIDALIPSSEMKGSTAADARLLFKKMRITGANKAGEQPGLHVERIYSDAALLAGTHRAVQTSAWLSGFLRKARLSIIAAKPPAPVDSGVTRPLAVRPDHLDDTLLPFGIPIAFKLPWEKDAVGEKELDKSQSSAGSSFPENLLPSSMGTADLPPGVKQIISYTFILVPDLRYFRITPEINADLHDWLRQVSGIYAWKLKEIKARPDFLQWIVSVPFDISQGKIVRVVRQFTSEQVFKKYPDVKPGKSIQDFWSAGYLASKSREGFDQEMVDNFIKQVRERQSTTPRRV